MQNLLWIQMFWTWLTQWRLWLCRRECVRALGFSACVCLRSAAAAAAAAALYLFAPAAFPLAHGVKNTHKSDIKMSGSARGGARGSTGVVPKPMRRKWVATPDPLLYNKRAGDNRLPQRHGGEEERLRRRTTSEEGGCKPCNTDINISVMRLRIADHFHMEVWKRRRSACVRRETRGCVSPPTEGETSWPCTALSLISSVFKKRTGHSAVITCLCQE